MKHQGASNLPGRRRSRILPLNRSFRFKRLLQEAEKIFAEAIVVVSQVGILQAKVAELEDKQPNYRQKRTWM